MVKSLQESGMKKAILLLFFFLWVSGYSCTVVIAWNGDNILVGNNEDWFDLNAKYWYEPVTEKHKYGAVYFGFKKDGKFAQGGMNEKGLFFDGLYIEKVNLDKSTRTGKKAAPQHVFKEMLHNAETVEEALEYLEPYFIPFIKNAQIVIADSKGDYAILNVNGITRRRLEKEKYVLISNFPAEQMTPKPNSDPTFEEANQYLMNSGPISTSTIKSILNICHQDGEVKSVYSNVFDLTNRRIDNYYLFDFTKSHVIDLVENVNCDANKTYLFKEIFQKRYEEVKATNKD